MYSGTSATGATGLFFFVVDVTQYIYDNVSAGEEKKARQSRK